MTIDHLVYAVPELEAGLADIEVLLGVRPVIGGRHPDFGTHNALLSLGPTTYLEIIAPDHTLSEPDEGFAFGITPNQAPGLLTWALRVEGIETVADRARAANVDVGPIQAGSRENPDGTMLSWQLSSPTAMPCDGAVPFLISWGSTVHPARTAPRGGELLSIRIEHPEADKVRAALAVFGVEIEVKQAMKYRLAATIKTKRGHVELK